MHTNSAFGISRALTYADLQPDGELNQALRGAASRWFGADEDYPGGWEPSGQDFLSAALCEAELLARLLPREDFPGWLGSFLPGIGGGEPPPCSPLRSSPIPRTATSPICAGSTSAGPGAGGGWPRASRRAIPASPCASGRSVVHAEASLEYVIGDDYMVEHWLAAYAVLLFS